jgi:tetratricopeptide (TPR) repeat protein
MPENRIYHHRAGCYRSLALIFSLVVLIYSNTFHSAWHLDDYQNIVFNKRVQIDNINPEALSQVIRPPLHDRIWRPVSFVTFALNWYLAPQSVFGFHLVNIIIHALTAWLLFITILRLLGAPVLQGRFAGSRYPIALISAVLWAVHPIQTQAVTYIVQRMTLLATLFYMLSMLCYIQARLGRAGPGRWAYFFGCALSFSLGIGSKEIAATLPVALILVETVFFQDLSKPGVRKKLLIIFIAGTAGIVLLGSIFFLQGDPLSVFGGYRTVDYSPLQRLMTQARILVLYITQIFYPIPQRLSIEHDIDISTSLVTPWTTLPASLLICGIVVLGLALLRKKPLLGFAITFFFLNHALESTVIPLELVFEHRNYLPTLFIFIPVAVGFKWALDYYHLKNRLFYFTVAGFFSLLVFWIGTGTYLRNYAWQTERTLWTDAAEKAPGMSRPFSSLAYGVYERSGQYGQALSYYQKALQLKQHRKYRRASLNNNIANIYFMAGEYKPAEFYWRRAIELYPKSPNYRYRLAIMLHRQGRREQALAQLDQVSSRHRHDFNILNLKGIILLHQGRPHQASASFKKCIRFFPDRPQGYIHAGAAIAAIGAPLQAEFLFKYARRLAPDNPNTLLRLVDMNLRTGDMREVQLYLQKLFAESSPYDIIKYLKKLSGEPYFESASRNLLLKTITDKFQKAGKDVSVIGENN